MHRSSSVAVEPLPDLDLATTNLFDLIDDKITDLGVIAGQTTVRHLHFLTATVRLGVGSIRDILAAVLSIEEPVAVDVALEIRAAHQAFLDYVYSEED